MRNGLTAADVKIGVFKFDAVLAIFLMAVTKYFRTKQLYRFNRRVRSVFPSEGIQYTKVKKVQWQKVEVVDHSASGIRKQRTNQKWCQATKPQGL